MTKIVQNKWIFHVCSSHTLTVTTLRKKCKCQSCAVTL